MNDLSQNFINGGFVEPSGTDSIDVINPANQEVIAQVADSSLDDVNNAVAAAKQAQPAWEKLPAISRAGYLRQISEKIRSNVDRLAKIISSEQGKVLDLAQTEVLFTADYIDYTAEWARRIEGEIISSDRADESIFLFRKPIGVTVGILPWNFPFFLIARKMAPALIAGNTIVIKSSEETPLNAVEFAKLVMETDLPEGVFNLINGKGVTAGKDLSAHKDVGLVSFTGSVRTGANIMESAARNLTRVNLELGGNAPVIVLSDADLNLTAKAIYDSRVLNTGQLCNCAERVYAEKSIADELAELIAAYMKDTVYGDPSIHQDATMGPLINDAALNKVKSLVEDSTSSGAEILTGGKLGKWDKGYHFEPTVLTQCSHEMPVMQQEVFGPVLPIQSVGSLDEAIELANDTDYGLTSSIFTNDLNAALQATRELRFGETYVNREHFEAMQGFHAGRRNSGIGGADGKHGLYEYMETHTVYMQGV